MKILYVVPYPPSLVRVRPFQMIRHLRTRGHDVTVATVWRSARDLRDVEALADEGPLIARRLPRWRPVWNMLRTFPTGAPLQSAYAWQPALAKDIQVRVRTVDFDVIHVEHLRGARYGEYLLDELGPARRRPPVVWDSVDCISYLFAQAIRGTHGARWRLLARVELPRTRRMEADLVRRFDRVLVTSEMDRAALGGSGRLPNGPAQAADHIRVVPNGVDVEYFSPSDGQGLSQSVVLSGKMSYHANVTACHHLVDDIMPAVWARCPGAHVFLVGQAPPRSLHRLAHQHPGRVTVTGAVDDLRPHLRGARVAVAPILYGAGIQNKVLEAMACTTPVVASPRAVAALRAAPGREVMVAEGAAAFADAIVSLLHDRPRARELGLAGRGYVERHHAWPAAVANLEAIYCDAMGEIADEASRRSGALETPVAPHRASPTLSGPQRVIKSGIDYLVSVPALVLVTPVLLLLALWIRLDSPGPALHRRRVLGRGGRRFDAFKLRTMFVNSDDTLARRPDLQAKLRESHKIEHDPRVTRAGRWLRRFSLDELPQLFNVVRGEMSLVGPRMISPPELVRFGDSRDLLLSVKPGLTGLWQVSGRSSLSYDDRVRLDARYVTGYTLRQDLKILFVRTLPAVLKGRGAY